MLSRRPARCESGSALVAAIAVLVLGAFVVVAIFTMARASSSSSKAQLASQASEQLARDAGAMLATIYSSGDAGEFDGFVPSRTVLQRHATAIGGAVVDNSTFSGSGLHTVDSRVPGDRRVAVSQPLDAQRTGYWQVLSGRMPTWGFTSGARITVYIRTWTQGGGITSKPQVYRLDFRPTWFADYQMLFDGPVAIGSTARLNGRVHSNGYRASFFNQYDAYYTAGQAIRLESGAQCVGNAKLSVSNLRIAGPGLGGCPAQFRVAGTSPRINLLRAQDSAAKLRAICALPAGSRRGIQMLCLNTTSRITVRLAGGSVVANGTSLNATVTGNVPGTSQGAVVVTGGDVSLSGQLGANARATVIAAAPAGATYGTGSAPSIWIEGGGNVGAADAPGSSFGAVAEGDVIFNERAACPLHVRGAIVAISGMPSMHPTWRIPLPVPGGVPCRSAFNMSGSIVSHFPPSMQSPTNNSGYQGARNYSYLGSLYNNPPPAFPTAEDWMMVGMSPANLDCFQGVNFRDSTGCR